MEGNSCKMSALLWSHVLVKGDSEIFISFFCLDTVLKEISQEFIKTTLHFLNMDKEEVKKTANC
jgi:hypothetical protein